jgi:hypothetical protein
MKRATPVLLFLGSNCASVYAFLSIRKLAFLSLAGTNVLGPHALDDVAIRKEYWTQGLIWLLVAVLLTMAFLLTARGRWRFFAIEPRPGVRPKPGLSIGTGVSSACSTARVRSNALRASASGCNLTPQAPTHCARVDRGSARPARAKMLSCR